MKKTVIIIAITLYIAQCTSSNKLVKNTAPTDKELVIAQKSDSKISIINLNKGYAIYTNQCTACHKAFTITKFSEKNGNTKLMI
jgi:cytochrome c5